MAVPLGGTGLTYAASTFFAMVFETVFYGQFQCSAFGPSSTFLRHIGIFLYIFIISTLVLYRNRPGSQTSLANMNLRLLSVSSLMFILGTIVCTLLFYLSMTNPPFF
jgi:phosphoglycerol transferase MdoB-like AlkP superfamily enzyme